MRLVVIAVLAGCARPHQPPPDRLGFQRPRFEARARDAAAYEECPTTCMRSRGIPVWPDWLEPYTGHALRLGTLECKVECLKQRVWRTKAHVATIDTSPL